MNLLQNDKAVSPVIGVILMVALTVVLGATVFIWVQGFSGQGQHAPATLGLNQNGAAVLTNASAATACATGATWCAKWTITSVTPGFAPTSLRVTDSTIPTVGTATCLVNGGAATSAPLAAGDVLACYTTTLPRVASGDQIVFTDSAADGSIAQLTLI